MPVSDETNATYILVIEDDPDIAATIVAVLNDEGYRTATLHDATRLDFTAETRPDVILLDYFMPNTNGIEVSQRLRADPITCTVPIIGMTASRSLPDEMQVDAVLTKPFDIDELIAVVAAQVAR